MCCLLLPVARRAKRFGLFVRNFFEPLNKAAESSRTRAQWLVLAAAFLGWMFDGLEMGIFPLVARPALQTMIPASTALAPDQFVGTWMGHITALFLVGAACGGLVFGWLGDRVGRVRAMTLSIFTYSIFTRLCFFAAAVAFWRAAVCGRPLRGRRIGAWRRA